MLNLKLHLQKNEKKNKDGNKVKSTFANRSIEGNINFGNQGKKGKTIVKGFSGKTVYKTNKKGVTTTKEKPKRKYK